MDAAKVDAFRTLLGAYGSLRQDAGMLEDWDTPADTADRDAVLTGMEKDLVKMAFGG